MVPTKTFDAGSRVNALVVWRDSLVSNSGNEIKQWNHEGVCVKMFGLFQDYVNTFVVWNESLFLGSGSKIKQWVDEEWEARRQRQRQQGIRNLLLVYSRSTPELNEDCAKEIATYF